MSKFSYSVNDERRIDILSTEMLQIIENKFEDFIPSGYLNGTEKADSYKLITVLKKVEV